MVIRNFQEQFNYMLIELYQHYQVKKTKDEATVKMLEKDVI